MRIAPRRIYANTTGVAMLMVWNQVERPLSKAIDLGAALQWAGVEPGERLSISSAIAGPSKAPVRETPFVSHFYTKNATIHLPRQPRDKHRKS